MNVLNIFLAKAIYRNVKLYTDERLEGMHNEELHSLYFSPNIIRTIRSRRMRRAGYVARMGETRNGYRILVGKPEGKTTRKTKT
jgi:hypothetical protein